MLTNQKVKNLLKDGYEHLSVDKKELFDIPVEMAQGDEWYLDGTSSVKRKKHYLSIMKPAFVLACLLLVFFGINTYQINFRTFATVYLDVNPSIEVSINRNEKVLNVYALNEDAERIIDGMDFKGSSLKVTVNALIGSLVRNGYINEINNSILVSVSDTDGKSGKQLEEELLNEISSLIDNGSVLSQQVYADDSVKALAQEYGISLGKAQLIIELADASGMYSYRDLVGLSIHELNLLNKKTEESSTQRIGEPSDQAYIGINGAIQIAFDHAGIDKASAYIDEAELEYDGSRMVYEVEFRFDGYEYDYTIEAKDGTVLRFEKEKSENNSYVSTGSSVDGIIASENAKQAALRHAGLSESQISNLRIELEYENGVLKYEIEFISGDKEFEYEVDARTGEILKSEKETEDHDDREEIHEDDDDKHEETYDLDDDHEHEEDDDIEDRDDDSEYDDDDDFEDDDD